jgi:predicted methyltransferase
MQNSRSDPRILPFVALLWAAAATAAAQPDPAALARDEARREAWQNVPAVFEALGVAPGGKVADIGAGGGFFTVRLARAVGPSGRVLAVEISERALEGLRARVEAEGLANVDLVHGEPDDPRLPEAALDAALIVNAYHEMEHYDAMLAQIRRALKPDGRLVIVEPITKRRRDRSREAQTREHEIAPEFVQQEARRAGFRIVGLQDPFVRRASGRDVEWLLVLSPDVQPTASESETSPGDAPEDARRDAGGRVPAAAGTDAEDWRSPSLRIAMDEFLALVETGEVTVLDVRDEPSYRQGHLPGAILVLPEELEERAGELRAFGRPIVTYCS